MAYSDIAAMARDNSLRDRTAACAATEGVIDPHPTTWADQHQWQIAASPGWGDAWASAIVSEVPSPGSDAGVITDQMILSAVQPMVMGNE